ncbi:helix-turn-helix transcriptional regulator [Caulobacter sp. FWC2]|uniref:helix-turn-helix transcriptional regulator n=1 Tax=Caulobacter sp. FWC2 TaxID=69664 RepID=UPI000C15233C|nr:helix-turn-helix transcriptional regulator [Caulobacter sp. FWC2]PIB92573.1 hypothetical protein CSW62_13935 [Caulobacter sp. FWC2]
MLRNDHHWLEISDLFATAALDGGWDTALNRFADACGGAHGQLSGVGSKPFGFNWTPRMAPQALEELINMDAEPASNPRARMGLRLPVLTAWHDADCGVEAEPGLDASYADFCRRHDIPHGSQTNLLREPSGLISLAVLRTKAQGVPDAEDRRAFETLAPQARSAVKIQLALEGRGAELLSGALEGLGRAAFVCDNSGLVQSLTPQAETLLRTGLFHLRRGRLSAAHGETHRQLETAIDAARHSVSKPGHGRVTSLIVRREASDAFEIIDVVGLPKARYAFGFEPRVLVVVRGAERDPDEIERLLQAAYGLTAAEAHVAMRLGAGESPDAIACGRQVSEGTIRTQLRAIYQKMDVSRQLEFAVSLARFR